MTNNNNRQTNSNQSLSNNKGTEKYRNQLVIIREFLFTNNATRYMIAELTGIPIQSVCYRIGALLKSGSVAIVKKDRCQISGHKAQYLTTDPEQFPDNLQTKINF